ncbi:unnamed protein product [Prunus armeniaca]
MAGPKTRPIALDTHALSARVDAVAKEHCVPMRSPSCHEHDRRSESRMLRSREPYEFASLGLAGNYHCSSTDGPLAGWSRGLPCDGVISVISGATCLCQASSPPPQHDRHNIEKNIWGPCRQLKTAKVTRVTNSRINIVYDERHQVAPTVDHHSSLAHNIGHVVRTHCLMKWKSWKVMPDKMRMEVQGQLSTNYNLKNLDDESLAYFNRLFAERFQAVLIKDGGAAGGNNKGGSKFPKIDVFGDVYVRPGNELVESLHATMMENSQLVLPESASHLPLDTPLEYVDPPQNTGF